VRGVATRGDTAGVLKLCELAARAPDGEAPTLGTATSCGSSAPAEASDFDASATETDDCARLLDPVRRDTWSLATEAIVSRASAKGALSAKGGRLPANSSPRTRAAASVWASIDEYGFGRNVADLPKALDSPPSTAVVAVSAGIMICFATLEERVLGCGGVATMAEFASQVSGCWLVARTAAVAGSGSRCGILGLAIAAADDAAGSGSPVRACTAAGPGLFETSCPRSTDILSNAAGDWLPADVPSDDDSGECGISKRPRTTVQTMTLMSAKLVSRPHRFASAFRGGEGEDEE